MNMKKHLKGFHSSPHPAAEIAEQLKLPRKERQKVMMRQFEESRLHYEVAAKKQFLELEEQLEFINSEEFINIDSLTVEHARSIPRWAKKERIFSIHHAGQYYYPAWQFTKGVPHPFIEVILQILHSSVKPITNWDIAIWFVDPTDWLSGDAPKDLLVWLDNDTLNRLKFAAKQEAADE